MSSAYWIMALIFLVFSGCKGIDGRDGLDGRDGFDGVDGASADIFYSEWLTPAEWSGESGDWYFIVDAPDLTEDIVERGVILAYAWLNGDIYDSNAMRPLPTYAVDANWSFLISEYQTIEFTTDLLSVPLPDHFFRFIAIPGNIETLKSASRENIPIEELKSMPYKDVCQLFNIPE